MRNINKLSQKFVREKSSCGLKAADVTRWSYRRLQNPSVMSNAARVTTYFDGIESLFIELSRAHEVVVGAVAWLTNVSILQALSRPKHVAIIVQKEDFLRRDISFSSYPAQRRIQKKQYDDLNPFGFDDFIETYPGQQESHPQYNSTVQHCLFDNKGMYQMAPDAVRCLGFARSLHEPVTPRMHHKFLVFGHKTEGLVMWPTCVVTGSFNLTHNAVQSRENVLLIEDEKVCQSFLSEWAQLWCMSEPLNWASPEPSPDAMYVGT